MSPPALALQACLGLGSLLFAAGLEGCAPLPSQSGGPYLEFLAPAADASVSGTVGLQLAVLPAYGLEEIELRADGRRIGGFRRFPSDLYAHLDTTTLPDGEITLEATARYEDGDRLRATRRVRVENQGPAIELASPGEDAFAYREDGVFTFEVRAVDPSDVRAGRLQVGDQVVVQQDPLRDGVLSAEVDPEDFTDPEEPGEPTQITLAAEFVDRAGRRTIKSTQVTIRSRLKFAFPVLGAIETSPAVLPDGAVAVGTLRGRLYIVEEDGTERCNAVVRDEQVLSGPVVKPGGESVVWGTTQRLRQTSVQDCSTEWTYGPAAQWFAQPAVGDDGSVYATTFGGVLHAIAADGSERFRVNLSAALPAGGTAEGRGQTSLTADGTVVQGVRVGATEGAVIAVAPNGEVQWVFESPPVDEGVIATEDGIFFGAGDGRLYALDATGSRMWSREPLVGDGLEVRCLPALLSNGQVAVCDKSGSLRAFETPDGESAWEHSMRTESGPTTVLGGGVAAGPEGDLFVGDVLGIVHGFASDGSRRFEFAVPGIAEESIRARPALSDDTLFVGATNQRLYALWRLDRKRPDDAETP